MARGQLVLALRLAAGAKDKKHGQASYRKDGQWYLIRYGPTYRNVYRLTDVTPEESEQLQAMEKPHE